MAIFLVLPSLLLANAGLLKEKHIAMSWASKYSTDRIELLSHLFMSEFDLEERASEKLATRIVEKDTDWAKEILSEKGSAAESKIIAAAAIIASNQEGYGLGSTQTYMYFQKIPIPEEHLHFVGNIDRYLTRDLPVDSFLEPIS